MKPGRGYLVFALPISLVLAVAACGQSGHNQTGMPGPTTATTAPNATPRAAPSATAQKPMSLNTPPGGATAGSAQSMNEAQPMNEQTQGAGTFASLAGSKGYVTQSEAHNDPWLSSHFQQCDSNHDGKVTRQEYEACHKPGASSQQPQASGQ